MCIPVHQFPTVLTPGQSTQCFKMNIKNSDDNENFTQFEQKNQMTRKSVVGMNQ